MKRRNFIAGGLAAAAASVMSDQTSGQDEPDVNADKSINPDNLPVMKFEGKKIVNLDELNALLDKAESDWEKNPYDSSRPRLHVWVDKKDAVVVNWAGPCWGELEFCRRIWNKEVDYELLFIQGKTRTFFIIGVFKSDGSSEYT